jgi:transposase
MPKRSRISSRNYCVTVLAANAWWSFWDNARYHHAVLLALRKYRSVLTMPFLPPYSPQLVPIERVWKLARRIATHNRYFVTLAEVLDAIETCFDHWRNANLALRRLCGII